MISAVCATVGSILYSARLEAGRPTLGDGTFLLDVIGATVIGGTSLFGGKGKILWTFFGVLFFVLLSNTLNLMNLSAFHIDMVKGGVILVAALLDVARTRLLAGGDMTALLALDGLAKDWFGVPAVRDVTLAIEEGTSLGLIGENGAGKSTLMNMIGGVVAADPGAMLWRGEPYAPASAADATARGIAFIHQELNLFTNLSIAENIFIDGFPRRLRADRPRRHAETTRALLARLDLEHAPETIVGELAPGERQLVEIAKALHREADLIIFDEPTTSLTPRETARLFDVIARLKAEGRTVIYICHILGDVARLCDRIAVLRDGRLVDEGETRDMPVGRMIRSMIGRDLAGLFPDRLATPAAGGRLPGRGAEPGPACSRTSPSRSAPARSSGSSG